MSIEPRHYTNRMVEILKSFGKMNDVTLSLLNYLSDEDVYDWAICNGYIDPDEKSEDQSYIVEVQFDSDEMLYAVRLISESQEVEQTKWCQKDEIEAIINKLKEEFDIVRVKEIK